MSQNLTYKNKLLLIEKINAQLYEYKCSMSEFCNCIYFVLKIDNKFKVPKFDVNHFHNDKNVFCEYPRLTWNRENFTVGISFAYSEFYLRVTESDKEIVSQNFNFYGKMGRVTISKDFKSILNKYT